MVKDLLIQNVIQIISQRFFIFPVWAVFHDIFKHVLNFQIGTTVFRSFQGTDRCRYSRIGIRSGRCYHMIGKCGVVTTTMLCMKYQRDIENLRFQFGKLTVFAEHIQDVLGKAVLFLRVFDQQVFILTEMPVRMIRIYSDQRHFCDQLHGLAQGIFHAGVIRIIIVGVQSQHTSLHGIHDIFVGCFHDNITDKTVVQIHHIRQQIIKHR